MMYELSQPSTTRGNQMFLNKQMAVVQVDQGVNDNRGCTDPICLAIFIVLVLGFLGIFIYSLIQGAPLKVFTAYSDSVACQQTSFPYGFLPNNSSLQNAVCVQKCPDTGQTVSCNKNNISCPLGKITSSYNTFDIFIFCAPDPSTSNGSSVSSVIGFSSVGQWAYDIQNAYLVLIGAFVSTVFLSCIYICLLRCCTTVIIWISIVFILIAAIVVGTYIFLQGVGVKVSKYIPIYIPGSSTDLIITGCALWGFALIFLILVICLCKRINRGIAVVKTASIYLGQTCQVLFLPLITGLLMIGFLAALITGGIYLYSTGVISVAPSQVFAVISVQSITFILIIVYACGGLWLLFFIHGCNTFTLSSSACIWYWNHSANQTHNPVCHSISWLVCYHIGTIALSSFLFTIFFIIRLIVEIFDVNQQPEEGDNCCLACCFKCIKCCLCVCNIFLRFLSQGMYVQVAVNGTGYCSSTLAAFDIITNNTLKLTLTSGISFFVSFVGVLFITAGVTTASYFSQILIPHFAVALTDPVPITILSAIISFAISIIFLSIIGVSSSSIIQCYIIDQTRCKQKGMYAKSCPQDLRLLFDQNRLR